MPKFRRFSVLLFLAVASLSITVALPIVHGQTLASTASFSGSVSDSSGARVANAKVTLSNPEKGITRAFKTDPEGNFSFALLPAGTYTLTVEAAGFKTSKQAGNHTGSWPVCQPERHSNDRIGRANRGDRDGPSAPGG